MAYVQPNTVVELFEDIGISPNYDNVLYFATTQEKDSYFDALQKIATLRNLSYSRNQRGYITCGQNIKDVYNAGYMRYKNQDFENKWFYAFIDSVEYIANGTTKINFTMDVLTTWIGTFKLGQCFIERQHTLSDGIGENIADEGLNYGDYVIENWYDYTYTKTHTVIMIVESAEKGTGGGMYGGIYNGCKLTYTRSAESANTYIQNLIAENKADNIVNIYMIPSKYITEDLGTIFYREEHVNNKPYTSLDGYVPKNNKLYCYPYKYAEVTNCEGDRKDFKYEYFNTVPNTESSGTYSFIEGAVVGASTEASFTPKNYKVQTVSTTGDGSKEQMEERLSISNFPMCSWNVDTYKAYVAQTNSNFPVSVFSNFSQGAITGGLGSGSFVGALAGGAVNTLGTVINALAVNSYQTEMGTRNQGNQESSLLLATGNKGFRIYEKCITKNYASMIDDYFTAFGYAIRNIGIPNMNARPHWTYVKTVDCNVHGKLSADDARKIENIFNSGVRFWKDHTEIGNYSLDNSPQ